MSPPKFTRGGKKVDRTNPFYRTSKTCPPASEEAQLLGCYYRIRSDAEIDWIKYRNRQFLKSYREQKYQIKSSVATFVKSLVTSQPGITYFKLLQYQTVSPDDLNALLAAEELYIDLSAATLAEPEKVHRVC